MTSKIPLGDSVCVCMCVCFTTDRSYSIGKMQKLLQLTLDALVHICMLLHICNQNIYLFYALILLISISYLP